MNLQQQLGNEDNFRQNEERKEYSLNIKTHMQTTRKL